MFSSESFHFCFYGATHHHLTISIEFFFYRESDLSNQGYYLLAQELAYQWLGSWVTPLWWSDAHLNKALAGFLAASAALEV